MWTAIITNFVCLSIVRAQYPGVRAGPTLLLPLVSLGHGTHFQSGLSVFGLGSAEHTVIRVAPSNLICPCHFPAKIPQDMSLENRRGPGSVSLTYSGLHFQLRSEFVNIIYTSYTLSIIVWVPIFPTLSSIPLCCNTFRTLFLILSKFYIHLFLNVIYSRSSNNFVSL